MTLGGAGQCPSALVLVWPSRKEGKAHLETGASVSSSVGRQVDRHLVSHLLISTPACRTGGGTVSSGPSSPAWCGQRMSEPQASHGACLASVVTSVKGHNKTHFLPSSLARSVAMSVSALMLHSVNTFLSP
jgi:hypothetical protein